MPAGILLAVLAGTLVSCLPLVSWFQGPAMARQIWMILLGHLLALPATLLFALAMGSSLPEPRLIAFAALAGGCSGANGAIYYAGVMHRGPMSISWAVVWLNAVIVAAAGWLVLGEPIYVAQPIGVLCFLGCLATMARATYLVNRAAGSVQPIQRGYWPLLLAAMLVGVFGVMLIKIRPGGGNSLAEDLTFVVAQLSGLVTVLAAFILARRVPAPGDRRTAGAAALWAAIIAPHFVLLVVGLRLTDASVFQPTLSGTALALGVVWSLIRGERPHRLVYVGAAMALLSVVLINLRGPVLWPR